MIRFRKAKSRGNFADLVASSVNRLAGAGYVEGRNVKLNIGGQLVLDPAHRSSRSVTAHDDVIEINSAHPSAIWSVGYMFVPPMN